MALTKVIGAGLGTVTSADLDGAVTINESSADKDFRVESNGNANMLFVDGGSDNVFIGTATVRNAGLLSLDFSSASDGGVGINDTNSGNGAVFAGFLTGGTFRGSITNNNNTAVAYNTTSDYRLKENVSYTFDATTRLKQLKPARFNWIADETNTSQDGFLAHEVSSVVPEAITGTKDETRTTKNVVLDKDENIIGTDKTKDDWEKGKQDGKYSSDTSWKASITQKHYQQIDHSKIVPLLVKTIQELEARITALEGA
jgi:prepilin-type processing-associated H-X9-DG protein